MTSHVSTSVSPEGAVDLQMTSSSSPMTKWCFRKAGWGEASNLMSRIESWANKYGHGVETKIALNVELKNTSKSLCAFILLLLKRSIGPLERARKRQTSK